MVQFIRGSSFMQNVVYMACVQSRGGTRGDWGDRPP